MFDLGREISLVDLLLSCASSSHCRCGFLEPISQPFRMKHMAKPYGNFLEN